MVDPIISYVAGIGFLVLLIVPVLYLLYAEADTEEGDESPGESVVEGVGPVAEAGGDTEADTEAAAAAEETEDEADEESDEAAEAETGDEPDDEA